MAHAWPRTTEPAITIRKSVLRLSILSSNSHLRGCFDEPAFPLTTRDAIGDGFQPRAERMPVTAFAIVKTRAQLVPHRLQIANLFIEALNLGLEPGARLC